MPSIHVSRDLPGQKGLAAAAMWPYMGEVSTIFGCKQEQQMIEVIQQKVFVGSIVLFVLSVGCTDVSPVQQLVKDIAAE